MFSFLLYRLTQANEKYMGDTMLQKTFTEDFMTSMKVKNVGQRNRYYVKDSHPAINSFLLLFVSAYILEEKVSCGKLGFQSSAKYE
jgi:hypothetical protein